MLDFKPYHSSQRTMQQIADGLTVAGLAALTAEMCDMQLELIATATDLDVVYVPDDPEANDTFAARPEDLKLAWTLGHVIVHSTASSEESASRALTLARGLPVPGRSRYEVPWQQVQTVEFCRARIRESRRMRLAMLSAWPDQPRLDTMFVSREGATPLNAFGAFIGGLEHDDSHLDQIRKVLAQSVRARELQG